MGALAAGMNTAKAQWGAREYVDGSVKIVGSMDIFMGSSVSKTRRNTDSGGHSDGHSVHHSSGGISHGGGHGKF